MGCYLLWNAVTWDSGCNFHSSPSSPSPLTIWAILPSCGFDHVRCTCTIFILLLVSSISDDQLHRLYEAQGADLWQVQVQSSLFASFSSLWSFTIFLTKHCCAGIHIRTSCFPVIIVMLVNLAFFGWYCVETYPDRSGNHFNHFTKVLSNNLQRSYWSPGVGGCVCV